MGVILFLGAFVTLGAYLLYNWSVTQVKVTLAAAYVNLIPVFTLLLAYLLLGETLSALQWVACAAVLAGIGRPTAGQRRVAPAATRLTPSWATVWAGTTLYEGAHHERHELAGRGQSCLSHHPSPWPMPGTGGAGRGSGGRGGALHRRAVGVRPAQADEEARHYLSGRD
jgi:hypothetical protein